MTQEDENRNGTGTLPLSDEHKRMLIEESRIDPEVIAERGTRTVTVKAELKRLGFGENQRQTPGVVFPVHNVRGEEESHTFRPDSPRKKDGKWVKYEIPTGSQMLLDVPPRCRPLLRDPKVPIFITEGPKKADALASLDVCVVGVVGVWNFRGTNDEGGKALLADFEEIAFNGRPVIFAFDSDIMTKLPVYQALRRLSEVVKRREGRVRYLYLPHGEHGEKQGVDDFLAANPKAGRDDLLDMATPRLKVPPQEDPRRSEYDSLSKVLGEAAPATGELVVPPAYKVGRGGITELRYNVRSGEESSVQIAHEPVYIAARATDIDSGEESLRVCFKRGKAWREILVPRTTIASTRDLVGLAGEGFPVTTVNAPSMVKYLAVFEAENIHELPEARVSSRMGWQGRDGRDGFLLGHRLISPEGNLEGQDLDDLDPEEWGQNPIAFRGPEGTRQVAEAFRPEGTPDGWREAIEPLLDHPRALILLLGSFASPLLTILKTSNFTVDSSYHTTAGKTTALRAAGSVWGDPNERNPASVVGTFLSTGVFVERFASSADNLPLILDETKEAPNPRAISTLLYEHSSGKAKGRGSVKGVQHRGSWSSVMLTTGEQPITSFSKDGGTVARVVLVWGMPFGERNAETLEIVQNVDAGVQRHFGHAGPEFVSFLIENRDKWDDWRDQFLERKASYQKAAGENVVLGRLGDHLATLDSTRLLLNLSGVLPRDLDDPIQEIWDDLAAEVREGDRPSSALELVVSWASSNAERFVGREASDGMGEVAVPRIGYAGRWDEPVWDFIAFYPHVLREIIERAEYDPTSILRAWRDRKWIEADPGKTTKQIRVGDRGKPRMTIIRRVAIEQVIAPSEVKNDF